MSLPWWRRLLALSKAGTGASGSRSGRKRSRFFRQLRLEYLEDRTVLSTFQWTGASSTNWSDAGNWAGGPAGTFPNAQGDVAQFTGSYSAAQTVLVNQTITVGEIDFGT